MSVSSEGEFACVCACVKRERERERERPAVLPRVQSVLDRSRDQRAVGVYSQTLRSHRGRKGESDRGFGIT